MESCNLFGVSPVLPVPDLRATVAFYSTQLGFDAEELWGDPPTHGSVNRGRVGIQFTAAPHGYDPRSFPGSVYVFVDDVARLADEFRSRGGDMEPAEEKEYGMIEMADPRPEWVPNRVWPIRSRPLRAISGACLSRAGAAPRSRGLSFGI